MLKVYSKMLTGLGFPADSTLPKNTKPRMVIAAASLRSESISLLSEGQLKRLSIIQTAGVAVAFEVELFDSKIPFPVGEVSDATVPADTPDNYRVIPRQIGVSGVGLSVNTMTDGYSFANKDGTPTNNERLLYIVIIPTSSGGETEWDVAITVERDTP